jgi:hypothetical protein
VEYTEYGVQYRACEVLEVDIPTMRIRSNFYIDRPERINTTDGDHCQTCMFLSVYYYATQANKELDSKMPPEDLW